MYAICFFTSLTRILKLLFVLLHPIFCTKAISVDLIYTARGLDECERNPLHMNILFQNERKQQIGQKIPVWHFIVISRTRNGNIILLSYSYATKALPQMNSFKSFECDPHTMESKRDSMGHLGTHLVSVSLSRAKMDSFWVAIFCSG